ncbi:MAG TPA: hypothetical protein PKK59_07545 [Anaerolineaceae bacterium]|nr:hypothetical protein [Anaerolineaceae bacterium]
MKLPILPVSRPGKWSAGLALGAILVFVLLYLLGERLGVLPDALISTAGALAIAAAVMAAVSGLSALVRFKERALLVYISVVFGLAVIVFLLTSFWADARGLPG